MTTEELRVLQAKLDGHARNWLHALITPARLTVELLDLPGRGPRLVVVARIPDEDIRRALDAPPPPTPAEEREDA